MKKTLEVLNRLVSEGIVNDYAIGGAMGAMFYMESVMALSSPGFAREQFNRLLEKHGLWERFARWQLQ